MKKKYFLNANIVDPYNSVEEVGGLIINEEGICSGCLVHEEKENLDWEYRLNKLKNLIKP